VLQRLVVKHLVGSRRRGRARGASGGSRTNKGVDRAMAGGHKEISPKAMKEFISEAEEIIERLNQNLLRLDRRDQGGRVDPDTLNEIFRAAHSLKGLAGMFGISTMTTLSHHLEEMLDKLRLGKITLTGSLLDLLFESLELLGRIVEQASAGEGSGDPLRSTRCCAPGRRHLVPQGGRENPIERLGSIRDPRRAHRVRGAPTRRERPGAEPDPQIHAARSGDLRPVAQRSTARPGRTAR
jgi:chemotaxis protein histidine kinase CheA